MLEHEILLHELQTIRPFLAKNSIEERHVQQIKQRLDSIPFFSSLIFKYNVEGFQRVTINKRLFGGQNKRIEEIKLLKYPPAQCVHRYGRANLQKESVLYATFDPITAFSEMRPEVGDTVSISTWEKHTSYDLSVSPVFKNTSKDGVIHSELSLRASIEYDKVLRELDSRTAKQVDILIQFMADCFAKEVEDSNHFDYYMSAYFANKILRIFQSGEVDAVLYPSVRQSLTLTNIALKPEIFDTHFKPTCVEESVVMTTPSINGGWSLKATGTSRKFDGDKIIW